MNPTQEKYILDNIKNKSLQKIAQELGLRERNIKRFLDSKGIKHAGHVSSSSAPVFEEPDEAPAVKEKSLTHALFILFIVIIVFASYFTALHNDYIWDDEFLVLNNVHIRNFSHAADIFKTYLAASSGNRNNFYRPIQELSYMIDHSLWGKDPFGYHLTNLILHALCAVVLYLLLLRILHSSLASFIAAALFGIHPINTEAVSYIAGRADTLYLLFFLISFILFLKSVDSMRDASRPNTVFFIFSIFAYLLSILSKEIGIAAPFLFIIYVFTFYGRSSVRSRLYMMCIPYFAVALLYAIARKTFLDFSSLSPVPLMAQFNILVRLLTAFKATCVYLYLLIMPFGLHMERDIKIASMTDVSALGAFIVITLIGVAVWRSYFKSKKVFFACAWFIFGLLPVSNIFPINAFIAEHWMYMPAIGIFMIAGIACENTYNKLTSSDFGAALKVAVTLVLIAVFVFFGVLTSERNKDWKDMVTFFKNTLKYSPDRWRLHLMLGKTYYGKKQMPEALEEFQIAAKLNPVSAEAYANIGAIYAADGNLMETKRYIEKALAINPDFPNALYMLGSVYEEEGNYPSAQEAYSKAISILPSFASCRIRLGNLYMRQGHPDKAISQWNSVLNIDPGNSDARRLIEQYGKAK